MNHDASESSTFPGIHWLSFGGVGRGDRVEKVIEYTRWTEEDSRDNQISTSKSVNHKFIRAWNIWKTSNIAALMIDVL